MKLIINASTLSGSGVTQVATSFIEECKNFVDNQYLVFMSKTVAAQLDPSAYPSNFRFHTVNYFGKAWTKHGQRKRHAS